MARWLLAVSGVLFLINEAIACMPGYEAERAKLRQYLGIEWVAIGDQLLFTGDRKKAVKDAILVGWPIKCQNSTGLLTFTFWIYNGARVEVLLMEDVQVDKNRTEIRFLPEKPHIDCGTVTVNTECRAEIPPRDAPFRLAIRAYDIGNPDGAFVMLDNIFYEAQFCKVAVDFGPDFTVEPLMTSAQGMPVATATDLACSSFDRDCRWRNGGHAGMIPWGRGMGRLSEMLVFNETGTYTTPKPPYAFLYVEQDEKSGTKMLISDPVQCQASTGSTLTFRVWSSRGVQISTCVLDYDMNELECQPVSTARSPAPSSHHFEHTKTFMYGIKVTASCERPGQLRDHRRHRLRGDFVLGSVQFVGFGRRLLHDPNAQRDSESGRSLGKEDLDCTFAKRALDCFWAPLEDGGVNKWEVGPENSRFARFNKRQKHAPTMLISETVRCFKGGASLLFNYWHTGEATLSVCVIRSFSDEILDCQNVGANTADRIEVDIPNYQEPIRLAFKAELNEVPDADGLVAIDDIELHAQLCSPVAYSANSVVGSHSQSKFASPFDFDDGPQSDVAAVSSPTSRKLQHELPDANVCRLLSCNFDLGHMCLYESHRVGASVSMFSAFNQSVHTMLFERSQVAMLESTPFRLNAPARLHFDYAITKGAAQLHVCQDSIRQELDSCYTVVNAENAPARGVFVHDFIEVLPSDTKLYVIARLEAGSRKASIFVDNLELTTVENQKIC
ncbi:MAM domain and Concanavalin A-like lectin/glucanases superfamily domain-containing protein [Aphelenchoides fujianensis]|nr:MAM domain and Concanavalin A-like lectin/glucanases superfamily domain-containing protein [Aphelenchoides fujianensis]